MSKQKIKPSLFVAVLPFIFLIVVMLIGNIVYGAPAQLPLILGIAFTCILGHFLGYSYQEIENSMIETNKMGLQANFIMLIVGCLIGSWIVGGVVPGMIYYGLKLFTPRIFLIILPVMCAIISVSTGSAWTTAGTMGTAAMGIGVGMGIPAPLVAGAVVTGASFGDKLSPLSDSTNLAAATAEAGLFDHVRHMLKTTILSFLIALLIYAFLGRNFGSADINSEAIESITSTLANNFKITPLIFIPPIIIIAVIFLKVPPVPGMLIGTLEDAGTLTSGLVPWSTCGAVYLATLGVSAFQYGRYHILGLVNPIVAIIYAYFLICLNPLNKSKPIKDRLTDEDLKDL